MTDKSNKKPSVIVTPTFRVSFPSVFQPKEGPNGGEAKYSVTMLFPKATNLNELRRIANEAGIKKWGPNKDKWPKKNFRQPFRDGDQEEYDGYAGMIFCSARNTKKPKVLDQRKEEILDENDFYAGCYARAAITAFAYDNNGNRGISFSLQHIQKVKDGESFTSRVVAEDIFEELEDDGSNDASNFENDLDLDDSYNDDSLPF